MNDKNIAQQRFLQRLAQLDENLFLKLFNGNSPNWLKVSALSFSKSGDGGLYLLLAILLSWFETEQQSYFATALLLGFLIERPIYYVAKNSFARVRPCDCLVKGAYIIPSDKFSLPSGHSAGAFVVAVILCQYFPILSWLWLSWATGVATSRVLLGVHFPADVIIDAFIGSSCGLLALMCIEVL